MKPKKNLVKMLKGATSMFDNNRNIISDIHTLVEAKKIPFPAFYYDWGR